MRWQGTAEEAERAYQQGLADAERALAAREAEAVQPVTPAKPRRVTVPKALRQRVLACLAQGMSRAATAREAGVALGTIKKWQARGDADVLAALAEGKAAKAKVAA